MRTDGATVTSGLMMYNLKVGPNAACKEMYQDVISYTNDYSLKIAGLIGMIRGTVDLNPASSVDSNLSVCPSTEFENIESSNVTTNISHYNQAAFISPVCVKRRYLDDVILQNAKRLRPPIKGSTSVRSVNSLR